MAPVVREPAAPRRVRRAPDTPVSSQARTRKVVQVLLVFVTVVLVLNAFVGERGFMETLRARRQHQALVHSIEQIRAERARLEDEVRRLESDPATIEAVAREELGLIRPGEVLFIIRDVRPSAAGTPR
jgi:cell division protein FtsB